jgi:iron(III) transport system ATP-binding protein
LEPLVLLFDEPLSNLDAKLRRRVRDDIRDLQSRLNLTVVYVTQDQQEALAISDQVIVMAQAAIAQSGPPRDLYENPANMFVADFIGDANIVDAELGACSGDRVQVRLAGLDITLPGRNMSSGPVKLAVHLEAIRLCRDKPAGLALPARLVKMVYLGSHMKYTVDCALGALFVIDRTTSETYATSSELWIRFCHTGVTILSH